MKIWFASTNKGKISECKLILDKELPQVQLGTLDEIPSYTQPPENGKSFQENARIKAKSLRSMKPGEWVFAEDSGLEVTGMNGLPGVHSAVYAGPHARDSENVAKLLKMMQIKGLMDRSARFHCCLIAYDPSGNEHIFEGNFEGSISKNPAGQHGFGYDPIFVPKGETKTLAELGSGFKVQHSHRTMALKKLIAVLKR